MANILIGIVCLLLAGLCGLFFCGPLFVHGWNEGLYRLESLRLDQVILALGAVLFFILGVSYFFKRKKSPPVS
jgi:hypothetical protein